MTEDEAKTKWCPFATAVRWNAPSGGNRLMRNDTGTESPVAVACRCLGSACMAWRWAKDYERRWDLPADKPPEGEGWQRVEALVGVAHWVRQSKTPQGYCGLAGAPQ